jgi:hypothetical protein
MTTQPLAPAADTDLALHGLSCPNCAGMVPIPEGQEIVNCPYCDQRSLVRGERGLRRYQVPISVNRKQARNAVGQFFKSSWAIARDLSKKAKLEEEFIVYLPFWIKWSKVLGWVFGQKKVGSGKNSRYEPREVKIVQDMHWNGAACDVGEFGVESLPINDQEFEAFDNDALHASGMVFEPVGSETVAHASADQDFNQRVYDAANLDRNVNVYLRQIRERMGLVYYPLWVVRYLYRGRSFQVVVDGHTGKTLYGKAPGNTFYRAAALVVGMMLGAFISIDMSAAAILLGINSDDDALGAFVVALVLFGFGMAAMAGGYRRFRYGEVHEYSQHKKKKKRKFRRMTAGGVQKVKEQA